MSHVSSELRRRVRLRARNLCEYCRSPTFTRVIGRAPTGRATVEALRLNRQSLVSARQIWVRHGLHPPELHAL